MKFINLTLLVLLALLQYRLWAGHGSVVAVHELEIQKAQQLQENTELMERNLSLAAEVLDLKQGMEAIEERARSEMGMVRKDETFYRIISRPE